MEKKTFTIIGVIILGVILGVAISVNQSKQPLLEEMIKQQGQILQSQSKLEKKLVSEGEGMEGSRKQADLERRVMMLELQVVRLQTQLSQGQGQVRAQAQQPQMPPQEDFSKAYDIPLDHSFVRGKKDAPVTIVEFVDFQCPFCARFHPPIEETLKAYPDQVSYVVKNFPLAFHPQARPAAKAALAAGEQGKYF